MKKNKHNNHPRRTIALLLATFLLIGGIMPLTAIPASAATLTSNQVDAIINWALAQQGSGAYYRDGMNYCQSFVADAYAQAGLGRQSAETATAAANLWCNHPGDRNPPRGAAVYYNWTYNGINYGHVGIALGDGRVVHAFTTTRTVIVSSNIDFMSGYRGWGVNGGHTLPSGGSGHTHSFYDVVNSEHESQYGSGDAHHRIVRKCDCGATQPTESWSTLASCSQCPGGGEPPKPPAQEIKVASYHNGTGQGGGLSIGYYPKPPFGPGPTIGNDEIAWISIPAGLACIGFIDSDYKGDYLKLYGRGDYDLTQVADGQFHREISSLIIGTESEIRAWSRPSPPIRELSVKTLPDIINGKYDMTLSDNSVVRGQKIDAWGVRYDFPADVAVSMVTPVNHVILTNLDGGYSGNARQEGDHLRALPGSSLRMRWGCTIYYEFSLCTKGVTGLTWIDQNPQKAVLTLEDGSRLSGTPVATASNGTHFVLPQDQWIEMTIEEDSVVVICPSNSIILGGAAKKETDGKGGSWIRGEKSAVLRIPAMLDIYDERWRPADTRAFIRECLLASGWLTIDAATEADAVASWARDLWWLRGSEAQTRACVIERMSNDRANFMRPAGVLTHFERVGDTLYVSFSNGRAYSIPRGADGAWVIQFEECYTYENLPAGWTLHHTASATDILAGSYTTIHGNGAIEFNTTQSQLRYRAKGGLTAWDNNTQPPTNPPGGTQPQPDPTQPPQRVPTRSIFEWILYIFCFGWLWMK